MKTGKKIVSATVGLFLLLWALSGGCTRQELDVVSQTPEFNEHSKEYQTYLFERAVTYIKSYKFGLVDEVTDRIIDEALKKEIDSLYRVYRLKASTEALYYVRPDGDTLFFIVSSYREPDRETRTQMDIRPTIEHANPEPLSRGILAGFRNYPALESLTALTFADEYRELDLLPRLEYLTLGIGDADLFEATYPDEKAPVMLPVAADLSGNHKLKKISLIDINIDRITFPDHRVDNLYLSGANADSPAIGQLKASLLQVALLNAGNGEFVIDNGQIDALTVEKQIDSDQPVTKVDVSRTNLKKIDLYIAVRELVLNENLEYLRFSTQKMETPPQLPVSLRELIVGWYHPAPDFSRLTNLEKLSFGSDPLPQGLVWPPNLVQLTADRASGTLDLSGLGLLRRMIIQETTEVLDEIIFPPNLVESELNDLESSFYSRFYISRSCKLTNMPQWMESHIQYRD